MEEKKFDFQKGEVLIFDKPLEWSSFNLVKKVRNIIRNNYNIKKIKVGHAGTLDPLATGLMIICTGKKTKEIDQYQAQTKEYYATLKLGATTPSFDLETEIDKEYEYKHINEKLIKETLKKFLGRIEQVPPVYSAVKVNGKRAYEFARSGEEVKLKAKILVIDEIEVISFKDQLLELRIVCSKGTYIRSLARDIGMALNSGAHLTQLRRSIIGKFNVKDAISIEEFKNLVCKYQ